MYRQRLNIIGFAILTTTLLIYFAKSTLAEQITFTKEFTYQASDFDSRHSSRTIALEMVKSLLFEELGTYLVSETEVSSMQLTKDQVTSYAAGIISAEEIEEIWDGKMFWLKAKVSVDPKEVQKTLKKIIDDEYKSKELEETRKKVEELTKENARFRKELEAGAKLEKRDKNTEAKYIKAYEQTIKGLNAIGWFKRGFEALITERWNEARGAFTKAIELKSDDEKAYLNRGFSCDMLSNYQQAIKDYNKAIELEPDFAYVYYNQGGSYYKLGNYQQAIKDYTKAIELKPEYVWAYSNRGIDYHKLGNYNQAINDFKIAARLGDKGAQNLLIKKGIQW